MEDEALEQGAKSSSFNNFQARYAIRHPWQGPIECEDPVRGRWGGPPKEDGTKSSEPAPAVARNVAFAKRDAKLGDFLAKASSGEGEEAQAPAVGSASPSASARTSSEVDEKRKSSCDACHVRPSRSSGGGLGAGFVGLFLLWRLRRRRMPRAKVAGPSDRQLLGGRRFHADHNGQLRTCAGCRPEGQAKGPGR